MTVFHIEKATFNLGTGGTLEVTSGTIAGEIKIWEEPGVLFRLAGPVACHEAQTFGIPETTEDAITIDARIKLGGDLLPDVRYPLIYFYHGTGVPWDEIDVPVYMFAQRKGGKYEIGLRVREEGSWIASPEFSSIDITDDIHIQIVLEPSLVTSHSPINLAIRGLGDPLAPIMNLQVGHTDRKPDKEGDEELPAGSILESLLVTEA